MYTLLRPVALMITSLCIEVGKKVYNNNSYNTTTTTTTTTTPPTTTTTNNNNNRIRFSIKNVNRI